MIRSTPHSRTGAAAVALVLILVFAQLTVVGSVIAGARVQDTTTQRLDSVRSFYSAEAGANMAIREIMRGSDDDGDGTVGSVSNNNNANDDPLLVKSRVVVTRTISAGNTVMTADARCGSTKRRVTANVSGAGGTTTQTMLAAFSRSGTSIPRYTTWNAGSSSWSSSSAMPTASGEAKWVRMKLSPTRNETTFIQEDTSKHVDVCFFNGTSWGSRTQLSSDTGGMNDRPEDIAYEQLSGDAMVMYWRGPISKFGYRVYNGTTFTAEQLVSNPFGTECDFLTLVPRPNSDDIIALAADGNAGGPLVSVKWNGGVFSTWTTLVSSLESNNEECYAMAFEAQTGKGVCAYIESGVATPRYRTLTGSTWSSQSSLPTIGGVGKWCHMASDPTSNSIIFAVVDDQSDINVCVWNGSSWGSVLEVENNAPGYDGRVFDVMFERGTGKGMIVYAESGQNTPRYRTWNGSAWSSELSLPSIGAVPNLVHLARGFTNGEVFAAISDASMDLHLLRWNGSSWSADTEIETSLGGWTQYNSFAVPEPTPQPHPRVITWVEAQP